MNSSEKTSAVTVTVLGEVKVIGLLVLSGILLGGTHSMVHLGNRQVNSPTAGGINPVDYSHAQTLSECQMCCCKAKAGHIIV